MVATYLFSLSNISSALATYAASSRGRSESVFVIGGGWCCTDFDSDVPAASEGIVAAIAGSDFVAVSLSPAIPTVKCFTKQLQG